MARYRHAITGALVSVREDKVLGSEWERLEGDDSLVQPVPVGGEPPRSGKGSGRVAWADHAAALGIDVGNEASRDDIIALVDGQD